MNNQNLSFSQALEAMKEGKKVTRGLWDSNTIAFMERGKYPIDDPGQNMVYGVHPNLYDFTEEDKYRTPPVLKKHNGIGFASFWTPKQNDLLAEDWQLI